MNDSVELKLVVNKEMMNILSNTECDGFYYKYEDNFEVILGDPEKVSVVDDETLMFYCDTYLEALIFMTYLSQLGHRVCMLGDYNELEEYQFIVYTNTSEYYPRLNPKKNSEENKE